MAPGKYDARNQQADLLPKQQEHPTYQVDWRGRRVTVVVRKPLLYILRHITASRHAIASGVVGVEPCRASAAALITPSTTALDFDDATWCEAKRAPQSPRIPVYIPPSSRCLRQSLPSSTLRRGIEIPRGTRRTVPRLTLSSRAILKFHSWLAVNDPRTTAPTSRAHRPVAHHAELVDVYTWCFWIMFVLFSMKCGGIDTSRSKPAGYRYNQRNVAPASKSRDFGVVGCCWPFRLVKHPTSTIPCLSSSRKVKREAAEERSRISWPKCCQ
ncbi:hypothetical protein D9611_011392 [Ephemerocybe angulata]|uniref:Uncharacterized protein n=1 Tax=Ephemerocybe angulata TaxID=980116 RepID=A0A8H5BBQ7_9AGAR|nr:hypothetical protein D9611_011392 [Tulosesus angulatus]